mmetsp:Transcript_13119/g.15291  ORF Transcript_13119/g.15291 Transcript_13119/m.15291 type:complete len:113 (-) Transcript_13119:1488-1826(-)
MEEENAASHQVARSLRLVPLTFVKCMAGELVAKNLDVRIQQFQGNCASDMVEDQGAKFLVARKVLVHHILTVMLMVEAIDVKAPVAIALLGLKLDSAENAKMLQTKEKNSHK